MGGDFDPLSAISPINRFSTDYPNAHVRVHTTHDLVDQFACALKGEFVSVVGSDCWVSPDCDPTVKNSWLNTTMAAALQASVNGSIALSCGNTGILMALSRRIIGRSKNVRRPAIAAQIPKIGGGHTLLMDVGANLVLSARHLHELAAVGAEHLKSRISAPKVALLNMGTEQHKGGDTLREASRLLSEDGHINYIGCIEPNNVFDIECDLVVTDGYTGNLLIKTAEGVCHFTYHEMLKAGVPTNQLVETRLDYRRYNGAVILGLNRPVFKSHGAADSFALYCALVQAHSANT